MGFEFHRNRTVMRKGIMIRLNRKARQVSKQEKINPKDAASLLSSMGWVKHTDTYGMYEERIKPVVNIRKLKKIVSKNQKRKNQKEKNKQRRQEKKNGNQVENRNWITGGAPAGDRQDLQRKICVSPQEH